MHTRRAGRREWIMAVLWSGSLALWCDRARRRALSLLLATLLLLIPSFPAQADCTYVGEGSHAAHHHEEDEACEHHDEEAAAPKVERRASSTSPTRGHAHVVAWSQISSARTATTCCSCPRAPLGTAVVSTSVPAPSQAGADTQALVYVRVNAFVPFAFDALTGLFGRAGPPGSKPKAVFLASLTGRAPPVSR